MLDIVTFSKKQAQVLTWWMPGSPVADARGIICDGAIRAGKTVPMSLSFIEWAMYSFHKHNFGVCGKTIDSIRRNVITWLVPQLRSHGYSVEENYSKNYFIVSGFGKTNTFYLFGGRDESSQSLIQGITLAGVFFDEVALMPESFVNQATGRTLSVKGAKLWFNCNPGAPNHFIKRDWIDAAEQKKVIHIHFRMEDNPILDAEQLQDAYNTYHGVFFKRYILGEWVAADGLIFDSFTDENIYYHDLPPHFKEGASHYIVGDYGTQNAFVLLHCVDDGDRAWVHNEFYYSGRNTNVQKTNAQYLEDYQRFREGINVRQTILDPSAASFKVELRRSGYRVIDADNDVLPGIELTSSLFHTKKLMINGNNCKNLINKLRSYVWQKSTETREEEKPLKIDDDPCDALRYFCKTVIKRAR